jgi:hypothetical protein
LALDGGLYVGAVVLVAEGRSETLADARRAADALLGALRVGAPTREETEPGVPVRVPALRGCGRSLRATRGRCGSAHRTAQGRRRRDPPSGERGLTPGEQLTVGKVPAPQRTPEP